MAANCAACLAVLSYAAFRSIVFHKSEFCKGVSDYGWSIWIIVITQIITVMVGSLGSGFRSIARLGMVLHSGRGQPSGLLQINSSHHIESEKVAFNFFTKKKGLGKHNCLCASIAFAAFSLSLIMTSSDSGASKITSPWKQELQHHVASVIEGFPERIMRVCAEDMKKWMDASNRNPLNHLVKFLSEPPSSTAVLDEVQQIGSKTFSKGYRLSCLTFVILERIISFSIPSARAESITQALDEAFGMIYYIDGKINVSKFDDQRKHHLAKTLWAYKGVYLSKNGSSTHSNNSSMSDAISSIKNEHQQFHAGLVAREMEVIISFILMHQAECTSMEEVYRHLEQLFIDMLHFVLSQLPIAILKDVNESPVEAHEERARFVLKLLYKLKSLEDKIQWSFPEGYRVTRLMDTEGEGINDEAGNTENQNATPVDDDHDGGATTIQEVPDKLFSSGPRPMSSTLGLAPPKTSCSGFSIPYEMKCYGHGLYLCPQNRLLDA
ncbi:hypothetical protein Syun_006107 [Stephania yunnanensis]|uniref:Uncharacterized protein n=1 Tax=Stephania yunnanensis TaxID=152371 RepID=A0AAP0KWB4_9MAGN